jgi:hypothetical protein
MTEQSVSDTIRIAIVGKERTHYWPLPRVTYCALHNKFLRMPPPIDNDARAQEIFAPCLDADPEVEAISDAIQGVVALLVQAGLPVPTQAAAAHAIVATRPTDNKIAIMAVPEEADMITALTQANDLCRMPIN